MTRLVRLLCFLSLLAIAACSPLDRTESVISGTIEGDELPIVAEVSGKVLQILAEEGSELKKQQVIARIDDSTLQLQVEEAKAAVLQATAKLEEAKAGTRNQAIQKGIAAVQQAEAGILQAQGRLRQANANLTRAQEQLQQVNAQLEGAKRTLAYQESRMQEAEKLFREGALSKRDYEAQKEALNQAQTMVRQLAAQVSAYRSQADVAQGEADAAEAQVQAARAQADNASAELDLLREGNTSYAIKALLAAEKQAKTKLELANLQLEKATITVPADGILLRKNVTTGEVAKAGATLFTMMKKDSLKVKVYIPEADLGTVKVGQTVQISVDAYPNERFSGVIATIADKAEFTPKNVQTRDERTKMVFAVSIHLREGWDKLKPGMPADVYLDEGGSAK